MNNDFDIIVVGYGAAGVAAAVTAARKGAKVLLLEKQPKDKHYSSTRMSGGIVMGIDDVEKAVIYLNACCGGMIPEDVNRAWAERALTVQDWMRSIGIESVHMAGGWYPQKPGFEAMQGFAPLARGVDPAGIKIDLPAPGELTFKWPVPFGNGQTLHDLLVEAVEAEPNIQVRFDSPALRLLRDGDAITGVRTQAGDEQCDNAARKGVILTCGGFEQDQELILNSLKAYPIYFYGSPANTGDGVRMAQAVGADLWHMNQMIGRCVGHFQHPDGREITFNISVNPPGYAILDKYGRRFANEHMQAVSKPHFYYELLHYDADTLGHSRIPAYWFFDKRRMDARPISMGSFGHYAWSSDNSAEVDMGWIKQGDTIEDVARAAGCLDPAAAARTIAEYNQACADKVDAFGRPESSLVPIDQPPYYCIPVYPGGATTNGGPRRDAKARILDPFGNPIPGLFGAGELGGAIGELYPAPGANLGEAFAFGVIAAETAIDG